MSGVAVVAVLALIGVFVVATGSGKKDDGAKPQAAANVQAAVNQPATNQPVASGGPTTEPVTAAGVKTSNLKANAEVCKQDGKPIVYLFSTNTCPHCQWIKDTFDGWAKKNADKIVAYHWEVDSGDNTLTSAVETTVPADQQALYDEFSWDSGRNGYVPTFVFGCKYFRVGNGYESAKDLNAEVAEYDAALNDLLK